MKFLLDENVEYRIATFLTTEGHDVTTIIQDYTRSIDDHEVLRLAQGEGRILITNDRDFGELIFSHHLPHAGVIYFRLPLDTGAADKINWLREVLAFYQVDLSAFIVITPAGIRVRRSESMDEPSE